MTFDIDEDNSPYIEARGKIILNACPGSGKTSAISYKLTALTEECEKSFGKYSGVACLSFTNVAKDEIAKKYRAISGNTLGYPHLVSTIDSFINQYITLPFYHLLGLKSKRPTILHEVSFLNEMILGNFRNKKNKPLRFSYPPSDLRYEFDNSISINGKNPNSQIVDENVFKNYAKTYKKWQFENGYLNNEDSTFIAYQILKKFPNIAKYIVQRFPFLIIDEAQDTSEIQYGIFDLLIEAGLQNIEFVGDPYQSLYEFREARPDLFMRKFSDTKNWRPLRFNYCRRSSQKIINGYTPLRAPGELGVISKCTHPTDNQLKVIRFNENDVSSLLTTYKDLNKSVGKNAILVRGTHYLEKFGIKTASIEPWKTGLAKQLIEAIRSFEDGNLKDCFMILREVYVFVTESGIDIHEQRRRLREINNDNDINIKLFEFIRKCPKTNVSIDTWTLQIQEYFKSEFGVDVDLGLKKNQGKDFYAQLVSDVFNAKTETPFPISTVHKVKGMTFNSILLVLSENSKGANISLSDFKTPNEFPTEKQRILYVALSRPEVLSCIAIPNSVSEEEIRAYINGDFELINLN